MERICADPLLQEAAWARDADSGLERREKNADLTQVNLHKEAATLMKEVNGGGQGGRSTSQGVNLLN